MHKEITYKLEKNGCRTCTSHKTGRDGYADIRFEGKKRNLHQLLYEFHHGPIPKGLVVMHSCDNKLCINPKHLSIGTPAQNSYDARIRGLYATGEKCPHSKLTKKQVATIRKTPPYHGYLTQLGRQFQVDRSTISYVVSGFTWKGVK